MNTLCDEKKIIYSFAKRNQGQQIPLSLSAVCVYACVYECVCQREGEREIVR